MISVAEFRADFPEFADTALYPDSLILYWQRVAALTLNQDRWGSPRTGTNPYTLYDVGMELIIAHNITIERRALDEGEAGGIPGLSSGIPSQKHVDKVSISYVTSFEMEEKAGYYNLTIYGTRLWRLIQMMGAGPIQVGADINPYPNGPWPGPPIWPPY